MKPLTRVALERLMRYHDYLARWNTGSPPKSVTSAQIGEALAIDGTQVRKDLAAIGVVGLGRVGFDICEICRVIRATLGFDEEHEAIIVGVGHLGGALLAYQGFAKYGFEIVAAFDSDERQVGTEIADCRVRPIRSLTPFMKSHDVDLAILAVPAEASQRLADRLVKAGVDTIWNFAPVRLEVPQHVFVRNAHISLPLSEISYRLKRKLTPA